MSEKCDPAESCQTCNQSASCSAEEKAAHTEERLAEKLADIKHKIMVMSGKGGVGKSTIAINLGAAMAGQGLRSQTDRGSGACYSASGTLPSSETDLHGLFHRKSGQPGGVARSAKTQCHSTVYQ